MFPRDIYPQLQKHLTTPEVVVLTGMRRVGKTTLLRQLYQDSTASHKIFLDMELPTNQLLFEQENYDAILTTLFPEIQPAQGKEFALFLDEIQLVRQLPSAIKYLYDHYNVKFFLSGSSSFYLKNHFFESLAGRKILFELFPLSFSEFLTFKGKHYTPAPTVTKALYLTYQPVYEEYVLYGGFPEVVLATTIEQKKEKLLDIFSSYYQKEVVALSDFRNNAAIRSLMLLLVERAGSLVDIQKLSLQLGISRATVMEYLDFLEGTYFISRIPPYSNSTDVQLRKAQKIYIADTGFITVLSKLEKGHVFENAIFHQLRLKSSRSALIPLTYFQQKDGQEIDFVVEDTQAVEVKRFATDSDEKKLQRLANKIGITTATLVSYEYTDLASVSYGFMI